jgi:hypothetical protein
MSSIVDSFLLSLLRFFAAERLSQPVPSDGTFPVYAGGVINASLSGAEVEAAAKRRKRRKEGKSSSDEATRATGLTDPTQRVLLDLELWDTEID